MLIRIAMYQPFGLSSDGYFLFFRIQKEGGNIEDKKKWMTSLWSFTLRKKLRFICMNRRRLKLRAVTFTPYSVVENCQCKDK